MFCCKQDNISLRGEGLVFRPHSLHDSEHEQRRKVHKRSGVFECEVPVEDTPLLESVDATTKEPRCPERDLVII